MAAPEMWLLGSSDYSARLAAMLGLPFAFADFFGNAGDIGPQVAALYRRQVQPSAYLDAPKLTVAVHVICAATAQQAHHIAASMRLAIVQLRSGGATTPLVPPDEAASLLPEEGREPSWQRSRGTLSRATRRACASRCARSGRTATRRTT